jgi:hypothetical protein
MVGQYETANLPLPDEGLEVHDEGFISSTVGADGRIGGKEIGHNVIVDLHATEFICSCRFVLAFNLTPYDYLLVVVDGEEVDGGAVRVGHGACSGHHR